MTASVGWLGAVAGFLALAIAGLGSQDAQTVRAAHLSMELIGWFVLVPLALASLLTGLIQSMGTEWGLFWHYWVLVKLLITVLATVVLLLYAQTLGYLAGIAAQTTCRAPTSAYCGPRRSSCTPAPPCCCCSWPRCWRCTSLGD
ncbi:hypothetical protein AB0M43_21365 [Longispora sp. NPDC051575]|uniref:hypothetical protein n=1 Tax=Longispora sp. NPDC051575 TaxID=3154943 RepID=UPI003440130B